MPSFRRLPVLVEAEQFIVDDAGYTNPFGAVKMAPPRDASPAEYMFLHKQSYVQTAHGPVLVKPGDWIVKGSRDCYPVAAEVFPLLFERVHEG